MCVPQSLVNVCLITLNYKGRHAPWTLKVFHFLFTLRRSCVLTHHIIQDFWITLSFSGVISNSALSSWTRSHLAHTAEHSTPQTSSLFPDLHSSLGTSVHSVSRTGNPALKWGVVRCTAGALLSARCSHAGGVKRRWHRLRLCLLRPRNG